VGFTCQYSSQTRLPSESWTQIWTDFTSELTPDKVKNATYRIVTGLAF